jgi:transposase
MPRAPHPYPSDLTDEQWALLEPLLESSDRHGKPTK